MKSKLFLIFSLIMLPIFALGDNHADATAAEEATEIVYDGSLQSNDFVGVSFWLATAIMLASTVFFFIERDRVKGKWKTSLSKWQWLCGY